jgi:hypothetical protein
MNQMVHIGRHPTWAYDRGAAETVLLLPAACPTSDSSSTRSAMRRPTAAGSFGRDSHT